MTGPNKGFPTELIDLPSKGWYYPESSVLSKGVVDIKYMSAREEDLLSSVNLLRKGVVLDKLMEAVIMTEGVNYDDLLVGDRNALIMATRILGYGKDYEVSITCPDCEKKTEYKVNLETLGTRDVEFKPEHKGKNEFTFQLPITKKTILFRLLTQGEEKKVAKEATAIQSKLGGDITPLVTTRMKHSIISIDGDATRGFINTFVDAMPARDSKAFRDFALTLMPDIDMTTDFECPECQFASRVEVPLDAGFFWPKSRV